MTYYGNSKTIWRFLTKADKKLKNRFIKWLNYVVRFILFVAHPYVWTFDGFAWKWRPLAPSLHFYALIRWGRCFQANLSLCLDNPVVQFFPTFIIFVILTLFFFDVIVCGRGGCCFWRNFDWITKYHKRFLWKNKTEYFVSFKIIGSVLML